jgi:hypothetical protein
LKAGVPGARAVVDVRKKMAVDVNHLMNYSPWSIKTKKRPSPKRRPCPDFTVWFALLLLEVNLLTAAGIGDEVKF